MTQTDQPANPQQPYGQVPKKKHTVRNVLIGIVLLFVLVIGGCAALLGSAANSIEKDAHKSGGTDNPMTITEGKGFEVDGFNYADGWKVVATPFGFDIKGLKVENNRDHKDSAIVEIKFWRGSEVLASADCTTDPIDVGTTAQVTCFGSHKLPKNYEKITINDTF